MIYIYGYFYLSEINEIRPTIVKVAPVQIIIVLGLFVKNGLF